jgi:hypothetical protein
MITLAEIDRKIRDLVGDDPLSRPFLCHGSPLECQVASVGINPATDTPFWPYWNAVNGFSKDHWLAEYRGRHKRLKPTRDRLEIFCGAMRPIKCLELNLYTHCSRNEATLAKDYQTTDLFDFMVDAVKPRLLFVHGNSPILHLSRLLKARIEKDAFTSASYLGQPLEIYASCRHMAYVSRGYASSMGEKLRVRIQAEMP